MTRSARKAIRDIIVLAVGGLLMGATDYFADLGLPAEAVPIASAFTLFVYRLLRERFDVLARYDDVR